MINRYIIKQIKITEYMLLIKYAYIEENPGDINTLTEMDGLLCDSDDSKDEIQSMFDYAPLHTKNVAIPFVYSTILKKMKLIMNYI